MFWSAISSSLAPVSKIWATLAWSIRCCSLAALVPKPRVNLTRYHGVFAPNSKHRARITPAKRGKGSTAKEDANAHAPNNTSPWHAPVKAGHKGTTSQACIWHWYANLWVRRHNQSHCLYRRSERDQAYPWSFRSARNEISANVST